MNNKKLIRSQFRDKVFSRDKHKCRKCSSSENLDAHHITDRNDMPNGGYAPENGISLCPECHKKAEAYHSSKKTKFIEGYHPVDLYVLIKSSFTEALKASEKL